MDRLWRLGLMRRLPMEEAVSEANQIADSLAAALPEEGDPRDELVALGMVASGVICQTAQHERADLVEAFCSILRKSVALELN